MPITEHLLNRRQFRAMPLYLQFAVGLMILYASGMTVLSLLAVPNGIAGAAVQLAIAAFVWVFALLVVPSQIASKYVSDG
jgi:hypothetical protein